MDLQEYRFSTDSTVDLCITSNIQSGTETDFRNLYREVPAITIQMTKAV